MISSLPDPDEISRGLAELELYVAAHAPAAPVDHAPAGREGEPEPEPAGQIGEGETRRVRRLRRQVAEAHQLAELQADDTPLLLDTPRVRRYRRRAIEAARLHALAQDPAARAWQAARVRRVLVTVAMIALALALGWSTAGVQAFAAEGADPWSPKWLFAWLVEPFLSLALLVVVGARAYMGTRGQPIRSRTLVRIEWLFLALTLGMNAWPHLPWATDGPFSVSALVLHILGPIVAVAIVTALPIILAAFADLDHGRPEAPVPSPSRTPIPPVVEDPPSTTSDLQWRGASHAPSRTPSTTPPRGRSLDEHRAELRRLIATGALPPHPSAAAIQRALRCREEWARQLRDELRGGAA